MNVLDQEGRQDYGEDMFWVAVREGRWRRVGKHAQLQRRSPRGTGAPTWQLAHVVWR